MNKVPYTKPALTVSQQVAKLKSRGMLFADEVFAEKFLSSVNYYRLSGYWLPFEASHDPHKFIKGTTFEQVVELYNFDKELRLLLFEGISIFEISFRTRWAYQMGLDLGSHSYLDVKNASDLGKWIDNMKSVQSEYGRSKEIFIQHFKQKYAENFPPVWVVCEIFSLGTISCWYKNLIGGKTKDAIAKFYGIDAALLESWVHCISVLRNHCAHQSRIVNKIFAVQPIKPKSQKLCVTALWSKQNKPYNLILLLIYLVSQNQSGKEWRQKMISFLNTHSNEAEKSLGFSKNWNLDNFWN